MLETLLLLVVTILFKLEIMSWLATGKFILDLKVLIKRFFRLCYILALSHGIF